MKSPKTVQEAPQAENPVETHQPDKNAVADQPEAKVVPTHESIAAAVIRIIPEAEKVAGEVLNLARFLEVTVRSHLASNASSQSQIADKNELSARLNPNK